MVETKCDARKESEILESLEKCLEGESELRALKLAIKLLYRAGERAGYEPAKLNAGGMSELLVSLEHSLSHERTMHGADAKTQEGAAVEQKNSEVVSRDQFKTNFVYRAPDRKRDEVRVAYLERVRAVWEHKADGYHLLTVLRSGEVVHSYRIESAFMNEFLREWLHWRMRTSPEKHDHTLNLGSTPCRKCGHYRRVRELSRESRSFERGEWTTERWQALFTRRVSRDCKECV